MLYKLQQLDFQRPPFTAQEPAPITDGRVEFANRTFSILVLHKQNVSPLLELGETKREERETKRIENSQKLLALKVNYFPLIDKIKQTLEQENLLKFSHSGTFAFGETKLYYNDLKIRDFELLHSFFDKFAGSWIITPKEHNKVELFIGSDVLIHYTGAPHPALADTTKTEFERYKFLLQTVRKMQEYYNERIVPIGLDSRGYFVFQSIDPNDENKLDCFISNQHGSVICYSSFGFMIGDIADNGLDSVGSTDE